MLKLNSHTFYGKLIEGTVRLTNKKIFDKTLAQYDDCNIIVEVRREKNKRTLDQNAYYWGVVLKTISIDTGHTEQELHDILKSFIPKKTLPFIKKDGSIVNIPVPRSTTELSTGEFSEYIERIRAKFAMEFGIIIPEAEGGKEKLNNDVMEVINSSYNDDYDPTKIVL